jgi:hypothetical protein
MKEQIKLAALVVLSGAVLAPFTAYADGIPNTGHMKSTPSPSPSTGTPGLQATMSTNPVAAVQRPTPQKPVAAAAQGQTSATRSVGPETAARSGQVKR